MSAQAIISMKELLKAGAENNDDGEAEAADADEEVEEEPQELLEQFMSSEMTYGLDDHADMVRSPIIMYHVKLAKEEARREKRKQQMIAEGMDEEDAERILLDEAAGGAASGVGGGGGTQNALATLIAAGARVTALDDSSSADAAQAEERRRQQRTIDAFLQKNRGIDTTKTMAKKGAGGTSKRQDNALEVAVKTSSIPFGGDTAKRASEKVELAKRGRVLLRGIHARREKSGLNRTRADDAPVERRAGGADGGLLSALDQAALLAELGEEDGEGDEGPEEEEEQDKLAA